MYDMSKDRRCYTMKENIAIIGLPRSGKTTKAKEFFENFNGCTLFVNTQHENYFSEYRIIYKHTDFSTKFDKTVWNIMHNADLITFIKALMDRQMKSKQLVPIRIIIDEIFRYQDCAPDAVQTLQMLMVDGLRWNIQTVITIHIPTMVKANIYKNVHVYYFFKLNPAIYSALKRDWKIDLMPYKDYLNIPYNYIVYDGNEFIQPTKIYTTENLKSYPLKKEINPIKEEGDIHETTPEGNTT